MRNELERNDASHGQVAARPWMTYSPATDILEENDRLVLRIDMPGVSKETLNVKFADQVLTIVGSRAANGNGMKARHEEFGELRYSRAFSIPDTIDATRTEAVLKNGVLTLTLPKTESARPRKIEVRMP